MPEREKYRGYKMVDILYHHVHLYGIPKYRSDVPRCIIGEEVSGSNPQCAKS